METGLKVYSEPVGLLGCNMSIISDAATKEAVVVDPGGDPEKIIGLLNAG
jgi:hypothetical protein